jgi:hypothetical protein
MALLNFDTLTGQQPGGMSVEEIIARIRGTMMPQEPAAPVATLTGSNVQPRQAPAPLPPILTPETRTAQFQPDQPQLERPQIDLSEFTDAPTATAPQVAGWETTVERDRDGGAKKMPGPGAPQRGWMEGFFRTLQGHDVANENATLRALVEKGLSPDMASAVVGNPRMMQAVAPSIFRPRTQVINNRLVNDRGQVVADFSDFARQGPEVKEITLPNGDKVSVMWNAQERRYVPVAGGPSAPSVGPGGAPLPDGVSPQAYRTARSKELGEQRARAETGLPSALRAGESMLTQIDEVLRDPALSRVTGPIDARLPNITGGANRAQSRIDQILGGAFLQAFESLKGGGQITEREGAAATAAITRLQNTRMGDGDYASALREFRTEVEKLIEIAKQRAGQAPAAAAPTGGSGGFTVRAVR